jgi:hypothetical protein
MKNHDHEYRSVNLFLFVVTVDFNKTDPKQKRRGLNEREEKC